MVVSLLWLLVKNLFFTRSDSFTKGFVDGKRFLLQLVGFVFAAKWLNGLDTLVYVVK